MATVILQGFLAGRSGLGLMDFGLEAIIAATPVALWKTKLTHYQIFLGHNCRIMLKRLASKYWPMVVLLISIGAILGVSRYAEDRKAEKPNNTQASSPQTAVPPNNASKSAENVEKTKHGPDFVDTFTWPEGATAWALFLTLIVIAWQSTETRDAAKAANAQIKMMKQKERAQLMVEILPIETLEFDVNASRVKLKFSNIGTTHAMNVYAEGAARGIVFENTELMRGFLKMVPRGFIDKPAFEPLAFEFEDLEVPAVIRADTSYGDTWVAFIFPDEWFDAILLRPTIAIEVRGEIRYEDVFGDPHFTRFSYKIRIPKWGDVNSQGSAPIKPHAPFSYWVPVDGEEGNKAT